MLAFHSHNIGSPAWHHSTPGGSLLGYVQLVLQRELVSRGTHVIARFPYREKKIFQLFIFNQLVISALSRVSFRSDKADRGPTAHKLFPLQGATLIFVQNCTFPYLFKLSFVLKLCHVYQG